jgi:serine/threonine protein kinase
MKDDAAAQMAMVMPFPDYDTLKMILEIVEGMEYLHSLGFIHRDLKASNIFVRPTITAAVDVYGFGMVCYELLTGHIPFQCEDICATDYDLVYSGRTPNLPDYLSPTMNLLLRGCWGQNPCQRAGWDRIKFFLSKY